MAEQGDKGTKHGHAAKEFRRQNQDLNRLRPDKVVSETLNPDNSKCVPRLHTELAKKRSLKMITTRECQDIDSDGSLCSGCREIKRFCRHIHLPVPPEVRNARRPTCDTPSRKTPKAELSRDRTKRILTINFTTSSHRELNISDHCLHIPPPQPEGSLANINSSASSIRSFASSNKGPIV